MNLRHRQRGLSTPAIILIILVAGFFGTCAIKLLPIYIESFSVKRAVEATVNQAKSKKMGPGEIKDVLSKQLDVNRIEVINTRTVVVTRKEGKTVLNANYEVRVPLMFNVDVVVKFDQLEYSF